MSVEMLEEDTDVFQSGVHALAVEGDHSVGGIAEDDAAGGEVVRVAFDADEGEVRVSGELFAETVFADEFAGAGEVVAEEC